MPQYEPDDPEVRAEFDRLCVLEPRLRMLYDEVAQVKDDTSETSFCANDVWYGNFKARLKSLVGWGAGYPPPTPDTLGIGKLFGSNESGASEHRFLTGADLVGIHREARTRIPGFPEYLTTDVAYDVAYDVIYGLLPDCRNCGCLG
jgi:hypothetical protein